MAYAKKDRHTLAFAKRGRDDSHCRTHKEKGTLAVDIWEQIVSSQKGARATEGRGFGFANTKKLCPENVTSKEVSSHSKHHNLMTCVSRNYCSFKQQEKLEHERTAPKVAKTQNDDCHVAETFSGQQARSSPSTGAVDTLKRKAEPKTRLVLTKGFAEQRPI